MNKFGVLRHINLYCNQHFRGMLILTKNIENKSIPLNILLAIFNKILLKIFISQDEQDNFCMISSSTKPWITKC